jgi:KUP system potassium uptake protein
MRANVEHNHVLHDRVVIVAVETAPVPVVAADQVATADDLGYRDDGITLITLQFGYMQFTDVPSALAALPADQLESPIDIEHASYFLSTIDFEIAEQPRMPRWRTLLFLGTCALAADAALAFELPRDRTVVIGSRISV